MKKKAAIKKSTSKYMVKKDSQKNCKLPAKGITATPISTKTTVIKTRPTQKELKTAAKKVMKQYSIAIKKLANR